MLKDPRDLESDPRDWTPDDNPIKDSLPPAGDPTGVLNPDDNPVVGVISDVAGKVVGVLVELVGEGLDEAKKQALSELSDNQQQALLTFANAMKLLNERVSKLEGLDKRFRQEVVGKSIRVATRSENMRLAAELYAATLSAYEALRSVFAALKEITRLIPELGDPVERFPPKLKDDPRFRAWVSSV